MIIAHVPFPAQAHHIGVDDGDWLARLSEYLKACPSPEAAVEAARLGEATLLLFYPPGSRLVRPDEFIQVRD